MSKIIPLQPRSSPPPSTPPAPATSGPWTLARLLTAPHRLGFFAAAVLMATTALWWAAALVARHAGLAMPWAVAPSIAHGLAMSFAFMPLFIIGFLFTAGPKWLGMPEVPARMLLAPALSLSFGWVVALAGFHTHALLAALGMGLATVGWALTLRRFVRLLRASRVPDRVHATGVAVAGAIGLLAMAMGTVGVAINDFALARTTALLGLWGFLAPTFAIVSHRMIPFFSAAAVPSLDVWKPLWLLAVMGGTFGVMTLAELAAAWWWPLPAPVHALLAALLAPAALLMLWLAVRWGLVQSLRIRLLAMLHGGFVWLGVALLLAALSHARIALWGAAASLGLAPLHALTMGYLGCTLIAMITRVAAGHSGRPLAADDTAWRLYGVLQVGVLLRVGAALWPQASTPLLLGAALAWGLACTAWAVRYSGWLGRPRIDGRPG